MKHSDTRSRPDPRSGLVPIALASIAIAAVLGPGCVTSGTHDRVVAERDALVVAKRDLEERVRLLRIANKSLDDHVAGLVEERENLLETREELTTDLATTLDKKRALASTLKNREKELAVTTAALASQSEKVQELQGTYEGLLGDLEEEVAKGQVRISQLRDGLQVGVAQEILFPSGSARLSRRGIEVLETVAARFADSTYSIAVEGHTDDLPISGALQKRYPSNWELAGARAASVVRLFAEGGVAGARLTAVSRGSTHPAADNSTSEGRARNRRIEILLRPMGESDVVDAPEAGPGSGS
jgi:chemotaxis protein MotB